MKKTIVVIAQLLFVAYTTLLPSASFAVTCGICSDGYRSCLFSKTEQICKSEKIKCEDACYGTNSGSAESGRSGDSALFVTIGIMILGALLYFRSNRKKGSVDKAISTDDERLWLESSNSFWVGVLDLVSKSGFSKSSTGLPAHRLTSGDIFFYEDAVWIRSLFRYGITLDAEAASRLKAVQLDPYAEGRAYRYNIDDGAIVFKAIANDIPVDYLVEFGNSWKVLSRKELPSSIEDVVGSLAKATKEPTKGKKLNKKSKDENVGNQSSSV